MLLLVSIVNHVIARKRLLNVIKNHFIGICVNTTTCDGDKSVCVCVCVYKRLDIGSDGNMAESYLMRLYKAKNQVSNCTLWATCSRCIVKYLLRLVFYTIK